MKQLVIAAILLVGFTSASHACRGTAEYPAVEQSLRGAAIPVDKKNELIERLLQGKAIHDEVHATNNTSKMKESLKILDSVKGKM